MTYRPSSAAVSFPLTGRATTIRNLCAAIAAPVSPSKRVQSMRAPTARCLISAARSMTKARSQRASHVARQRALQVPVRALHNDARYLARANRSAPDSGPIACALQAPP